MFDCLFFSNREGERLSSKMHGDARVYAFEDINPQTPTHMLILPKTHIAGLRAAKPNGR